MATTYSRQVVGVVAGGPGVQLTGASIDSGLGGQLNVGILGVFDVHVVTQTGSIDEGHELPHRRHPREGTGELRRKRRGKNSGAFEPAVS